MKTTYPQLLVAKAHALGAAALIGAVVFTAATFANAAAPAATPATAGQAKQPNILYFHVDNTGVGDWGCYGGAYPLGAKTPNVDRLAAEGLKLTN